MNPLSNFLKHEKFVADYLTSELKHNSGSAYTYFSTVNFNLIRYLRKSDENHVQKQSTPAT